MTDIQQFILSKLEKLDEKLDEVREHNAHMKAVFDSHMLHETERHEEVVKLGNSIDKQASLLKEYNQQLEVHMKRTDILESSVMPLVVAQVEKKAVSRWREGRWAMAAKVVGWLSAIGGLVVIILQIMSKL